MTSEQFLPEGTDERRHPAEDKQGTSQYERRLQKACECIDRGLERDDPFDASLAATTGTMMYVHAQLEEAIQKRLASREPTLEAFRSIAPSLELDLKLARQIDRQLQLLRKKSTNGDD